MNNKLLATTLKCYLSSFFSPSSAPASWARIITTSCSDTRKLVHLAKRCRSLRHAHVSWSGWPNKMESLPYSTFTFQGPLLSLGESVTSLVLVPPSGLTQGHSQSMSYFPFPRKLSSLASLGLLTFLPPPPPPGQLLLTLQDPAQQFPLLLSFLWFGEN